MLSEPIPALLPATNEPILIVAALPDGDVLYVEHDGYLKRSNGDWIITDWRYNAETKEWYDINGGASALFTELRALLGSEGWSEPGEGEDGEFGAELTLSLGEYRRLYTLLKPREVASQ